jgi:hypothetical protein
MLFGSDGLSPGGQSRDFPEVYVHFNALNFCSFRVLDLLLYDYALLSHLAIISQTVLRLRNHGLWVLRGFRAELRIRQCTYIM